MTCSSFLPIVREVNSVIGLAAIKAKAFSHLNLYDVIESSLAKIQCILQDFAYPDTDKADSIKYLEDGSTFLEARIKAFDLTVLPGGTEASCFLSLASAKCEQLALIVTDRPSINTFSSMSEYLSLLSRYINQESRTKETIYRN